MVRLLLKWALVIVFLLTTVGLAVRALGSIQPPNPALRGFTDGCEDKPQPCWYGIVPGFTNIILAEKQLISLGYELYDSTNIYLYFSNQNGGVSQARTCSNITVSSEGSSPTVFSVLLNGCDGIVFGDLSLIGFPAKIGPHSVKVGDYLLAEMRHKGVDNRYQRSQWSPNTEVPGLGIARSADLLGKPWHGFVSYWRYCQLEPNYVDCPP